MKYTAFVTEKRYVQVTFETDDDPREFVEEHFEQLGPEFQTYDLLEEDYEVGKVEPWARVLSQEEGE